MADQPTLNGLPITRVTFTTDVEGIMIEQYYVDASPISMNDIITIQGFDEGVLERGVSHYSGGHRCRTRSSRELC